MMRSLVLVAVAVAVCLAFIDLLEQRSELLGDKRAIETRWVQLDLDMRRRAELIPALLRLASTGGHVSNGATADAASASSNVLHASSKVDEIAANNALAEDLPRIVGRAGKYVRLRSKPGFLELEDAMETAENRIAIDRRDYNLAVSRYNTDLQLFPKNLAAALFGMHRDNAYFPTNEGERRAGR
jgi:LemA protein